MKNTFGTVVKFSILISNFNTKLQLVVDGWGLMTSVTRKRYLIQGLHIKKNVQYNLNQ